MSKLSSFVAATLLMFLLLTFEFYVQGLRKLSEASVTNHILYVYLLWKLLHDKKKD